MIDYTKHIRPTDPELRSGLTVVDICQVCDRIDSMSTRGLGNFCSGCGEAYPMNGPNIRTPAIWKKPPLGVGRGHWEFLPGMEN